MIGFKQFSIIKNLEKMTAGAVKTLAKKAWVEVAILLKKNDMEYSALAIINKNMGTNYRSLDQISQSKIQETYMTESFKGWWNVVREQGFPAMSFYPALTIWLELDKLFQDGDVDVSKVAAYSGLWLMIVSGKYMADYIKLKRQ